MAICKRNDYIANNDIIIMDCCIPNNKQVFK